MGTGDLPYRSYSSYLRERYGKPTFRIAVDAGFSCPNRDSGSPCSYCDPVGSRAPYLGDARSLEDQIVERERSILSRFAGRPEPELLLYFQAFSNTNAPVDHLRAVYDRGLAVRRFRGMIVATRPDCIDTERAELLASYRDRGLDVWVELGLQSADDSTLRRIGRGHTVAEFERAFRLLGDHGLEVAIHLIFGLPDEGVEAAVRSARLVAELRPVGVKLHNLVAVDGTPLYRQATAGLFAPPSGDDYLEMVIAFLESIPAETVVVRLTCDPPPRLRHLPAAFPEKSSFVNRLVREMNRRGTRQGSKLTLGVTHHDLASRLSGEADGDQR